MKVSTLNLRAAFATMAFGALGLAFVGCSSVKQTETPAGLQVSTLSITPATVAKNATTVVEGVVINNGAASANQIVTFTVTPSTAGYFTPTIDTSDANGLVASVFTATTVGNGTVTCAVVGGTARTAVVSIQSVSTGGTGNVLIDLTKSFLLANGASTSSVTITVRDQQGALAADSTNIKLTAGEKFVDVDGNGYWSNGVDSLVFDANGNDAWDGLGSVPSSAMVLGGQGKAVVTYTSGTVASTVYIKVTVDDNGITGNVEATIQLTPNAAINSIFLDADTIDLAVKQTGGYETGQLNAYCYDQNGNAVPEGITVGFIITDGPGGGENIANLGYGPYITTTNSQGMASAPISSGTVSGTVRVRAYSDTVLSNSTQLVINAGPAVELTVGVDTCNVRWWRTVGNEAGVLAVVRDVYHNPVKDSTAVYFTCDEGQVKAYEEATKFKKGVATTKWISGYNTTGKNGIVWLYAETSGGLVSDSVAFFNSDWADTIAVSGFSSSLTVDGDDKANFTLVLSDINGNPVINGLLVEHSERYLAVSVTPTRNQCAGSFATGSASRLSALSRDYSVPGGVDDGIGAIDTVRFFLESAWTQVVCTLRTGTSYSRNSSVMDLPGSLQGGQQTPFNVSVKDRFGNPLGGHTMVATSSAGTISSGTQLTNTYGEAYNFRFTAPADTTIKSVIVSVTDTDPRGGGMVMNKEVTITH